MALRSAIQRPAARTAVQYRQGCPGCTLAPSQQQSNSPPQTTSDMIVRSLYLALQVVATVEGKLVCAQDGSTVFEIGRLTASKHGACSWPPLSSCYLGFASPSQV